MPTTATRSAASHAYRDLTGYYDRLAPEWAARKNRYYFRNLIRLLQFLVPRG